MKTTKFIEKKNGRMNSNGDVLVNSDPYCAICFKSDFCDMKNDNIRPSWCPFSKVMDEHYNYLNKRKP